jgi:hypothetical protein
MREMQDLRTKSVETLMRLHYRVLDELKGRNIISAAHAPLGEYAEHLFAEAYDWKLSEQIFNAGFDATDRDGARIQIKARRLTGPSSRQLNAIHKLKQNPFDKLAVVLFTPDLEVARAAIIPLDIVKERSTYNPNTNSWRFLLEDTVWDLPNVQDATERVRLTAREH